MIFVTHAIDECLLTADNIFVLDNSPASIIYSETISSNQLDRKLSDEDLDSIRKKLLNINENY